MISGATSVHAGVSGLGELRRQTGRCEGRKRFGEHPGEEAVLHRIRQLHRTPRGRPRLSFGIVAQLNAEGLATRSERPWRGGTVLRILRRPTGL